MIDLASWCQMGGVMMGNDMSLEREHRVCRYVCPGSMTTQWLTLSLIEPVHRTSQSRFNVPPYKDLYILCMQVTTTRVFEYLKLTLSVYLCLFALLFFLIQIWFLSPSPPIMHISHPSCVRFFSIRSFFFILFPTMNLLESAHLIFKLTRQTSSAGG